MDRYYNEYRASIHRGVYPLAAEATEAYEVAREKVAAFTGSTAGETVFTKNGTEAINLVAYIVGLENLGPDDTVVLTQMEHHSNIVPWQIQGCRTEWVPITDDGLLDLDALDAALARGPKLVAVVHVSNVLGTVNPIAEIARRAHDAGALILVDGIQAVQHMPVDVPGSSTSTFLRLDRPQGLRADRHRRAARAPRAARADAVVPRRRPHDRPRDRGGLHARRAAGEVRGRHDDDRRGDRPRRVAGARGAGRGAGHSRRKRVAARAATVHARVARSAARRRPRD